MKIKPYILIALLILLAMTPSYTNGKINKIFQEQVVGYKINPSFEKALHNNRVNYDPKDKITMRILSDYGAVFLTEAVTPPYIIFPDEEAVTKWQNSVNTERKTISAINIQLQSAAMKALIEAQVAAQKEGLNISPDGTTAATRSYTSTAKLWLSRVEPGLTYHVRQKHISATEADAIRKLSPKDQIPKILDLESKGYYFSKSLDKSILYSVAAVGSSQHISMLALDVAQHTNPKVRAILANYGWFQTVASDQPHFTYLGVNEDKLPSLGLKKIMNGGRIYWIPDIETITK